MGGYYVKELFDLLRFLNVDQQGVVNALRVSKTQVSLWANGKRPLPKKTAPNFFDYVRRTIRESCATARRNNVEPKNPSLLGPPSTMEQFEDNLLLHLHRWDLECYTLTGGLSEDHKRHIETIKPYLHIDLLKLSAEDLTTYATGLRGALRTVRFLGHLRNRSDLTEGRWLSPPYRHQISPLEYFGQIIDRYQTGGMNDDGVDG